MSKTGNEPVRLRSLELDDLERCHRWHNNPELFAHLGGRFRYVSLEAERAWLQAVAGTRETAVNLAIVLAENGDHIGNVYLRDIDWVARHGELGIFLGEPQHRGKGYGASAVRQMLRHAFEDLGLLRVHLTVLEENSAAIRLYQKCGFAVEGVLRRHVFKQGDFKNLVIMGVCR